MQTKHAGTLALMSAALIVTSPADAASYSFEFLASDNSYLVSGMMTTADVTNGTSNGTSSGVNILGISGLVIGAGGGAITSLVANPDQPNATVNYGFSYDNVAFPANDPFLDTGGVLFTTNGAIWNLWGNGGRDYELYSYAPTAVDVHGSMNVNPTPSVAAIPEAETYAMLLAGLGLMAFVARRRNRRQSV